MGDQTFTSDFLYYALSIPFLIAVVAACYAVFGRRKGFYVLALALAFIVMNVTYDIRQSAAEWLAVNLLDQDKTVSVPVDYVTRIGRIPMSQFPKFDQETAAEIDITVRYEEAFRHGPVELPKSIDRYFAVTGDPAVGAYFGAYQTYLSHLLSGGEEYCFATLHGEPPAEDDRMAHRLLKGLHELTRQIVDHAVNIQNPPPTREWLAKVLREMERRGLIDGRNYQKRKLRCRDVLNLLTVDTSEIPPDEWAKWLRGLYLYGYVLASEEL